MAQGSQQVNQYHNLLAIINWHSGNIGTTCNCTTAKLKTYLYWKLTIYHPARGAMTLLQVNYLFLFCSAPWMVVAGYKSKNEMEKSFHVSWLTLTNGQFL